MWKKRLKNLLWLSVLVFAAGFQLWQERSHLRAPTVPGRTPAKTTQHRPSSNFEVLTDCQLAEDRNNDGDSFRIASSGETFEFRLYFVDCPEKRLHQYNGERLDHQGAYFGGLNRDQTIGIGLAAKKHTEALLSTRPFRIETRWQPVFDSGRFFAFVFFDDTDEELSESLTRAGLSRIYTEGTNLPDGRKKADFERHLKKLEAEAKKARRGAWGR